VSADVRSTGGYAIKSGSPLPSGLSLNADSGAITGMPTTVGEDRTAVVIVTDEAGNPAEVSINFPEVAAALTTTMVTLDDDIAVDDVVNIAEKAAGFTISGTTQPGADVTLTVGESDSLTATVTDRNWSFDVPVDADYITGTSVDVTVRARVTGQAEGSTTRTLTVDLAAPTLTFPPPTQEVRLRESTFLATLSEVVTGFDQGDLTVTNGEITTFGITESPLGTFLTLRILAAGSGPITLAIAADAFEDLAGNGNAELTAFRLATVNLGSATPIIALADGVMQPVTGPFGIIIEFQVASGLVLPVEGFAQDDIDVTGGTVMAFSGPDVNLRYTAMIAPADDVEGRVTVDIAADAATSAPVTGTTRVNTLAAITFEVQADTLAPTVVLARAGTPPETGTVTGEFDITVTFSEDVTGFASDDITVEGGVVKAGSFDASGAPVYAATIEPTANFDGAVTVDVAADVAADAAGNSNQAAAQLSVDADTLVPTATYTPPSSLTVGVAITAIVPQNVSSDVPTTGGYVIRGSNPLPSGLSINADNGEITGTPTMAGEEREAVVIVTDQVGNTADVSIQFPEVAKGAQTVSAPVYTPTTVTTADSAPTLSTAAMVTVPATGGGAVTYSTSTSTVCTRRDGFCVERHHGGGRCGEGRQFRCVRRAGVCGDD